MEELHHNHECIEGESRRRLLGATAAIDATERADLLGAGLLRSLVLVVIPPTTLPRWRFLRHVVHGGWNEQGSARPGRHWIGKGLWRDSTFLEFDYVGEA